MRNTVKMSLLVMIIAAVGAAAATIGGLPNETTFASSNVDVVGCEAVNPEVTFGARYIHDAGTGEGNGYFALGVPGAGAPSLTVTGLDACEGDVEVKLALVGPTQNSAGSVVTSDLTAGVLTWTTSETIPVEDILRVSILVQ